MLIIIEKPRFRVIFLCKLFKKKNGRYFMILASKTLAIDLIYGPITPKLIQFIKAITI